MAYMDPTMHPNEALLRDFYDAFSRRDGAAMAAAYAEDARFSDPVFPDLDGAAAGAMWQMLTESGDDLRVEADGFEADDTTGRARWQAYYGFGPQKRPVHNIITATFTFRDGKIATHRDDFDFWRWSRQALGLPGVLLGWTPFIQSQVRKQAARALAKWREKNTSQ